uniref:PpGpp synthetase catalytic domain-containing protein (RelA/SpoT-type nucleotidyltranferase) n=1 Tax=Candidatus Kentrum sp. FW TaxID=2126338 RepID=A0A450TVM3_9GAMM|nr:MAG: ppGpp synthetase catalytic domain-containing protein (RelA/SpoT-type nucleotidyltranferase) [Candidatus Kentron sp. FW]
MRRLERHGIKIHALTSRIKGIDSLIDKVRRKEITRPFEQIHDLIGFRIVCLFLSDLDRIRDIIREEFDVFEEDDKVNDSEIQIFGYMSLHLKAGLKHSHDIQSGHESPSIPFEIQVRTIAQDAWASVSHHLGYKRKGVIPERLKRDFYALSGLFYVADTHFAILQKEKLAEITRKDIR